MKMKMNVTKHNFEKITEMFTDAKGLDFAIKGAVLYGVTSVLVRTNYMGDTSSPDYEDCNGIRIIFVFNFEGGGHVDVDFRPDDECCELTELLGRFTFNIKIKGRN